MTTNVSKPAQWAQSEFSLVELGDQRRTQRLVKIATSLAQSPGGTLPQALPQWKELKAAYRFFSQPENRYEAILQPHWQRTLEQCQRPGEYLLIEDTTLLDYSAHRATEDLGINGSRGRGLRLHNTLALAVRGWDEQRKPRVELVGLLHQQCWAQAPRPKGEHDSNCFQRSSRSSQRWAQVLTDCPPPAAQSRWIYVADREADFYEPIQRCQQRGVDFIIRARKLRRLAGEAGTLLEGVERGPVLGQQEIELRARPGMAARRAVVQLRSHQVRLRGPWRPGGFLEELQPVSVLEAKELNPPPGIEALHWVLLTSLPCGELESAQRVTGRYGGRWHIEEYHKALKSGAGVEDSQLEQAYRLQSLIAVLSLVALRLLHTKLAARAPEQVPLKPEVIGPEALRILEARIGKPKGDWTPSTFWVAVAKLGGFIGRKSDGSPGWKNIWRGWQRLIWMTQGLETLNQPKKRCG
jgi:hypothetical protein